MLEKTFQPAEIEPRIHSEWEKAEAFKAGRSASGGKNAPYAIVIPPPNVTGSLHMGHALNNTLQDVLVRFERMRGRDVLWQPGTDHAGIATQMVVERQMAANGEPGRRDIGREKFLEKVWTWKAESGGTIVNQLKRLGASCDWSRERFTMDEGLSKAVVKVFVELHRAKDSNGKSLIYKDKRLVNWDPKFQTAISDLEVVPTEKRGSFTWASGDPEKPFDEAALSKVLAKDPSGHMYYFRYPLAAKVKGYDKDYIVVATTRPETMLGDTGVAVHPEDERYAALVKAGAKVKLPLVGREIPIVADDYSDPAKGTGAVKITPAHDFNDFEVGKRQLDRSRWSIRRSTFSSDSDVRQVTQRRDSASKFAYRGMDRFGARKKVVAEINALGLLEKIEPTTHTVPHGDRSGVVIEPWLTDQWYVNAGELAKPALAAVKSGKTRFVPERFANDYYRWLENIQPWCVSRQLWWGHQIPAWYGPDGKFFVAMDEGEAKKLAQTHYKKEIQVVASKASADEILLNRGSRTKIGSLWIYRDEDVLDTWFSSALWPFSTLGWPDDTSELKKYYPTSALVTGFDIIFFWVARMMMMGEHFMPDVPFKDVYIHGLVRDGQGHKMSKSRGNVIDPLDVIDGIGVDALVAKRTAGLNKEQANKIEKEVRKDYPEGIKSYGTDALRFTMAAMAAQGSDVKLSMDRVEGYRNFATKLWNAARFAEMNECVRQQEFDPRTVKNTINKWIVGETETAVNAVTASIEAYKFNEAAITAYEFVWGQFCDWYLELIKPLLAGDEEAAKAETRAVTAWVLDQILKILHPFMPFITEELWAHMVEHGVARRSMLCLSEWPHLDGLVDQNAVDEINWIVRLVSEIRSVRTEMSVPAGAKIPLVLVGADAALRERALRNEDTIKRLARLDAITFEKNAPKAAALIVTGETTAALPLTGIIDMGAEKARLEKAIAAAKSDLAKMDAKLTNPSFIERAKEEAIAEAKARKAELEADIKRFSAALSRLGDA